MNVTDGALKVLIQPVLVTQELREKAETGEMEMNTGDSILRALIRLVPVARSLKDEVEKSIHMELPLSGDLAMKSLKGLLASVARVSDDPYVASLAESIGSGEYETDRERVMAVLLVASQLVAYLEGETGFVPQGESPRQYAPNINIVNVKGMMGREIMRLAGVDTEPEDEEGN